jgi:hypothetical protein
LYVVPGVTAILFLYAKPPPPPPEPAVPWQHVVARAPLPPAPTTTTDIEVTPVGATQEKLPEVVKDSLVGAGVTLLDGALAGPSPTALVALTVNVYAVPFVNPETVIVPEPACDKVPVTPPGEEVAVYDVIVAPPSDAGAVKSTVAVVAPVAVAVPIVGAPGALNVVTLLLDELGKLGPKALVAITLNV